MTLFGHRDSIAHIRRTLTGHKSPPPVEPRRTRVIGHRGAARHEPENTIASFARALELGAEGIETDVCLTRDRVPVLWHDNSPTAFVSMARGVGAEDYPWSANWPGVLEEDRRPIWEMTLAEMRQACGYSRAKGVGGLVIGDTEPSVGFALLEDLLAWAAREPRLAELDIDVKLEAEQAGDAPLLLDAIARGPRRADMTVCFLCPQREVFEALRGRDRPDRFHLVPDFELPGVLRDVDELGLRRVSMGFTKRRRWGDFQKELTSVVAAREDGVLDAVTVWTINAEDQLRFLLEARVDSILTDDMPLLRRLVAERG